MYSGPASEPLWFQLPPPPAQRYCLCLCCVCVCVCASQDHRQPRIQASYHSLWIHNTTSLLLRLLMHPGSTSRPAKPTLYTSMPFVSWSLLEDHVWILAGVQSRACTAPSTLPSQWLSGVQLISYLLEAQSVCLSACVLMCVSARACVCLCRPLRFS